MLIYHCQSLDHRVNLAWFDSKCFKIIQQCWSLQMHVLPSFNSWIMYEEFWKIIWGICDSSGWQRVGQIRKFYKYRNKTCAHAFNLNICGNVIVKNKAEKEIQAFICHYTEARWRVSPELLQQWALLHGSTSLCKKNWFQLFLPDFSCFYHYKVFPHVCACGKIKTLF